MKTRTSNGANSDKAYRNTDVHPIKAGTCVMVRYGQSTKLDYYPAKVVSVRPTASSFDYFVHYKGWNSRFDEWIKARFVELPNEHHSNSSKSPKSDNIASHSSSKDSSKDTVRTASLDEVTKTSSLKNNTPGVIVQKRPKGRPPTKHLQQAANKSKLLFHSTTASKRPEKIPSPVTNTVSNSENQVDPIGTDSKNSQQKELQSIHPKPSQPNSSSLPTRHKNEHETSPNSLLIPSIGGGGHRRTRNSLEDAILNAVLEQSVLESNKTSDPSPSNIPPDDNKEIYPILNSGAQSDNDLGHQRKVTANQESMPHPIKPTTLQTKTTTSNRGRKVKPNSRKSSPSRKVTITSEYISNVDASSTHTGSKPEGIKKLKLVKEKLSNDTYNPPNYYKYNELQESRRKRTADSIDSTRADANIKVENDTRVKSPSLAGNKPSKPDSFYPTKHQKSNTYTSTSNVSNDNKEGISTATSRNVHATEYKPKNKNLTKSSIAFITKINSMSEYVHQKSKTLESELTPKPSLDNIRNMENFLSEIQQFYQKVKQKLRKLERGRKKYLQQNS